MTPLNLTSSTLWWQSRPYTHRHTIINPLQPLKKKKTGKKKTGGGKKKTSGGKKKGGKKKGSKSKGKGKKTAEKKVAPVPDPFSFDAMLNAYYIAHGPVQFLEFRGYRWSGGPKKKKKGGGKKKKK